VLAEKTGVRENCLPVFNENLGSWTFCHCYHVLTRYICRCQNKDGWLKVRVQSMLATLVSRNKMIIQTEKTKATSRYSRLSYSSFVLNLSVKFIF
jgi:hypothetical protein